MIVDKLSNISLYVDLIPQLFEVEKFIIDHRLDSDLDCGKYLIDGNKLFALVQQYQTKNSNDVKWESHRKYIDVQFIYGGEELVGYSPMEELIPLVDYNDENDIIFYSGPRNYTGVTLSEGMFAIFYPGEGHLPCCISESQSNVKKIVFKIQKGK